MSVSWTASKNGFFFNIASFDVISGSRSLGSVRAGWCSVRALVSQCAFVSFCILIYHRHGKLLCLWRLQKLQPVRTSRSSPQVSITIKVTVLYSLSFVPGAVWAGEETGFLLSARKTRSCVAFTSDQMISIPAIWWSSTWYAEARILIVVYYQWHQIVLYR